MRRHARRDGQRERTRKPETGYRAAERAILWLYWLVSGYGLRASRALIALAVTIVLVFAFLFDLWGFDRIEASGRCSSRREHIEPVPGSRNGALSPPRGRPADLAATAGPLFFGLALLSLRGRVKR